MKICSSLEKIINEQINHEMASSYVYLAMHAWLETTPYKGFSRWMLEQSKEETGHAMRFLDYLLDRQGTVHLMPLAEPRKTYKSPLEVFETSLKQEQQITGLIHKIYALAEKEKDYETRHFLSWFLQEQVEEEKSTGDMVDALRLAGDHINALMRLDAKAGARGGS